jgi:hypothetical protein
MQTRVFTICAESAICLDNMLCATDSRRHDLHGTGSNSDNVGLLADDNDERLTSNSPFRRLSEAKRHSLWACRHDHPLSATGTVTSTHARKKLVVGSVPSFTIPASCL